MQLDPARNLPYLQALENFRELTLEPWEYVLSQQGLSQLQFADRAIRTVHLQAPRLRVEHQDEPYTSTEPLGDFLFHFIRGVIG
jgi:hypothetical protein